MVAGIRSRQRTIMFVLVAVVALAAVVAPLVMSGIGRTSKSEAAASTVKHSASSDAGGGAEPSPPPDPISNSPAKRFDELTFPQGFSATFTTNPSIANKPDSAEWDSNGPEAYPVHFSLKPAAEGADDPLGIFGSAAGYLRGG